MGPLSDPSPDVVPQCYPLWVAGLFEPATDEETWRVGQPDRVIAWIIQRAADDGGTEVNAAPRPVTTTGTPITDVCNDLFFGSSYREAYEAARDEASDRNLARQKR